MPLSEEEALSSTEEMWRVGHHADPLQPTPRHLYTWVNRFDDPHHHYRTTYAAETPATALREVLQDLRPNAKMKAEFASLPGSDALLPAGSVPWEWRQAHVLVRVRAVCDAGPLVDLDDPGIRNDLESVHAALLAQHEMDHLDISQIRSKTRIVTQTIGRTLYDDGASGISFGSNTDNQRCVALFEGRGHLEAVDDPVPLTTDHPDLLRVCSEYGLVLRRGDLPPSAVRGRSGARLFLFVLRLLGRV